MIRLQKGLLTRGVRLENSRGHSPLLLALLDVFSSGNLKVHITLDDAHMGYVLSLSNKDHQSLQEVSKFQEQIFLVSFAPKTNKIIV